MPKACPVVHFEMPYHDAARASAFYATAFGWKTQPLGAEAGNYVLLETTKSKDGRAKTPGAINGGLFPFKADMPAQAPLVVIGVEDIEAAMQRVAEAGGAVYGSPVKIPGVGHYVAFADCEGNSAAMLQPAD